MLALSHIVPATASTADLAVQNNPFSGQNTYETLVEYTSHYGSLRGGPRYDATFDLNHNGRVGQTDGKILLRLLPPIGRKLPISLNLWLAPRDRINGHHPTNSGGVTALQSPTVVGHTSPGALVFVGTGTTDIKLQGPAYVADAQGNFSFQDNLDAGINQLDIQVVDRYGQQKLRSFPIYWTRFRAYEMRHPKNL